MLIPPRRGNSSKRKIRLARGFSSEKNVVQDPNVVGTSTWLPFTRAATLTAAQGGIVRLPAAALGELSCIIMTCVY